MDNCEITCQGCMVDFNEGNVNVVDSELDLCTSCEYEYLMEKIEFGELEPINFSICHDGSSWAVATEICSKGGCDTRLISTTSIQTAYELALKMTKEGKEPEIGYPCKDCRTT